MVEMSKAAALFLLLSVQRAFGIEGEEDMHAPRDRMALEEINEIDAFHSVIMCGDQESYYIEERKICVSALLADSIRQSWKAHNRQCRERYGGGTLFDIKPRHALKDINFLWAFAKHLFQKEGKILQKGSMMIGTRLKVDMQAVAVSDEVYDLLPGLATRYLATNTTATGDFCIFFGSSEWFDESADIIKAIHAPCSFEAEFILCQKQTAVQELKSSEAVSSLLAKQQQRQHSLLIGVLCATLYS